MYYVKQFLYASFRRGVERKIAKSMVWKNSILHIFVCRMCLQFGANVNFLVHAFQWEAKSNFLRFDWSNRIREVSKDKTTLMPCPSMGPKLFWTNQIILVEYQLFWTGPICFGRVQIILDRSKLQKNSPEKSNLNLTKMIWTLSKQFGRSKIILYL